MNAYLITHKDAVLGENKIYYFKKKVCLHLCNKFLVNIFADARYKLYINGKLAAVGPCKGTERERYYDSVDIADYLTEGENEFFAEILQLTTSKEDSRLALKFMLSVYRSGFAAFGLIGNGYNEKGEEISSVATDETWRVSKENGIDFVSTKYCFFTGLYETVDGDLYQKNKAESAVCIEPFLRHESDKLYFGEISPLYARLSPMPMMYFGKEKDFDSFSGGVYDAGRLTNAYVRIKCRGKGTISLTYAECYSFEEGDTVKKYDRADKNGVLLGDSDIFTLNGDTIIERESFWFRTFRFVGIKTTGDAELVSISYSETGYPLGNPTPCDFGNETDNRLFEISRHTLQCCMQETYTDCPYYEQLQYTMDTFMQMQFTYQLTTDDRAARRAMRDFALSQYADGMIAARSPSNTQQIIPSFSIYFIRMVDAHYRRFGDISVVERYIHVIDGILDWHHARIEDNGLLKQSLYWNFSDWAINWEETRGEPPVSEGESITVQNLMYAAALDIAAGLYFALGGVSAAEEYKKRSLKIKSCVNEQCFDVEKQLYADGNYKNTYSQQTQIWAVLSGAASKPLSKTILLNSFELTAQATFGYSYDLFRALEMADIYEKRSNMIGRLYDLIYKNCTTIPETTDDHPRSECHGWGAVVLFEFTAMDLGIRDINTPEKTIQIKPYINDRNSAIGSIPTKFGEVYVKWEKKNNEFSIEIHSPVIFKKTVCLPNGEAFTSFDSKINLRCGI